LERDLFTDGEKAKPLLSLQHVLTPLLVAFFKLLFYLTEKLLEVRLGQFQDLVNFLVKFG